MCLLHFQLEISRMSRDTFPMLNLLPHLLLLLISRVLNVKREFWIGSFHSSSPSSTTVKWLRNGWNKVKIPLYIRKNVGLGWKLLKFNLLWCKLTYSTFNNQQKNLMEVTFIPSSPAVESRVPPSFSIRLLYFRCSNG